MTRIAQRVQGIQTHFFANLRPTLARLEKQGVDVIRLDEGSPDLPPAAHIIDALHRAASRPDTHGYQSQRGTAELRNAWAVMYERVHGVQLDPESQVLPLLGSKEGIYHLPTAFVEANEIVLVPDPGYITYSRGAQMSGAVVHYMPLRANRGFFPDFEAIPADILERARVMWLNYPNNPTAAVASEESFSKAVAFAKMHQLLICHDAAYTQITFDGRPAPSLLQIPGAMDLAVEFNTLSKTYNMAGWRVAAAVGSPQAIETLYTLKTNIDSGHFYPIQEAAVKALTGDQSWLIERNTIYRRRRDCLVEGLRTLGFSVEYPQASLYIWFPLPSGWESDEFAYSLLEHTGVSFTPGTVFGQQGRGFMRVSITAPQERIEEALKRMQGWLKTWD